MAVKPFASLILLVVVCSFSSFERLEEPRIGRIFHQMYDSIKAIKTLRQNIMALERIENKYTVTRSEIKIQSQPRKIYFINPVKKLEVLYNSELYTNKSWVKPHVFPYMTLLLDPHGNIMRKNQHYSIYELGYEFLGKSIALTINKDKGGLNNFKYMGKASKNGYNCFLLEYENKTYDYIDYVVREKETATIIAYRLCVNEYLLRDKNDLHNDFGFLKKGTILKVPTLYCQKAVLFIEEKMMLPVSVSLFDDKGLFESYEYSNIRINTPIMPEEFLKDYAAYKF